VTRYIAFLRAINVGGHVVKMTDLRDMFESLRFGGIETFIASGNVIFDAPSSDAGALEHQIEQRLARSLGYEVSTFLRTPAELAAAAAATPFADSEPAAAVHTISVGFLKTVPAMDALSRVTALTTDVDDFRVIGRELYWRCRVRTSDSKVSGARLEKALSAPATLRNITTVRKLAAKYAP
jgi:uncharacterized protein (DUF1697 family)